MNLKIAAQGALLDRRRIGGSGLNDSGRPTSEENGMVIRRCKGQ